MRINSSNKRGVKYLIISILIIVVSIFAYKIIKQESNKNDKNLVEMGYIENSKMYTGYLIKEETVIDIDYSKTYVPVVADGQRASKGQTVATYRGTEYISNAEKLAEMDAEILESMQNLPEVYAAEVQVMDKEILNIIKSIEKETSYVKIQDKKVMVNNLLNKRAKVTAENSPQGETVRKLIAERNQYEQSTKTSKDNIKATDGGVISYKLDGLETKNAFNNIGAIDISGVREKINAQKISNGIKIVNNYEAYILIEIKGIDKKYLEVGKTNKIRIVGFKNLELEGKIYRVRELDNNSYEVMYKITNKIEEIASLREMEIEIVWISSYGLFIPNDAIKLKEDVNYVTVLKYGEYIDVPINIKRQNDNFSIIDNIEDRKSIGGSWGTYNIKVYDQLVIDENGD